MKRIAALGVVGLAVAGTTVLGYLRGNNSPPIAPAGGESFTNFAAIGTTHYLQRDARWKNQTIGSGETLANVGCTVSSLAMALEALGITNTPGQLNDSLKASGGYSRRGWLMWGAVQKISEGKVSVRIVKKPKPTDLDAALRARHPILAKVFIHKTIPHWVLVPAKEGTNYLMRDPLNEALTLEPLSKYGSDIYAVRIIEPGK